VSYLLRGIPALEINRWQKHGSVSVPAHRNIITGKLRRSTISRKEQGGCGSRMKSAKSGLGTLSRFFQGKSTSFGIQALGRCICYVAAPRVTSTPTPFLRKAILRRRLLNVAAAGKLYGPRRSRRFSSVYERDLRTSLLAQLFGGQAAPNAGVVWPWLDPWRRKCPSMRLAGYLLVDHAEMRYFTAPVRTFLSTLAVSTLAAVGCAGHRGGSASFSDIPVAGKSSVPSNQLIMTPDTLLVGKVAKVNVDGRFVVLTFPIGHLPTLDQRLNIYRRGLKVGEVRITGPQLDDNVVGDIAAGEAQAGDEVRSQ
jgi:hypothetical protein